MLLKTTELLSLHSKLLTTSAKLTLKVGTMVGRGFADVGFEEFIVISDRELFSLNMAKIVEISSDWREHFFPIYSPDELSSKLYELGFDIEKLVYLDQREWQLSGDIRGEIKVCSARSLEEVLLTMYISCLECVEN